MLLQDNFLYILYDELIKTTTICLEPKYFMKYDDTHTGLFFQTKHFIVVAFTYKGFKSHFSIIQHALFFHLY